MSKKIYLDYQATTPVDPQILKKMMPYFNENFGNPHSNNHDYGRKAAEAVIPVKIINIIETSKLVNHSRKIKLAA